MTQGLTLTLLDREAGILATALVMFVGCVGSQAWNIAKCILHQTRAKDNHQDQDGLHHHQQLVLRNSDDHALAL